MELTKAAIQRMIQDEVTRQINDLKKYIDTQVKKIMYHLDKQATEIKIIKEGDNL